VLNRTRVQLTANSYRAANVEKDGIAPDTGQGLFGQELFSLGGRGAGEVREGVEGFARQCRLRERQSRLVVAAVG